MHGAIKNVNSTCFIHRNMCDLDLFLEHLRYRNEPYISISDALEGRGDALSIDDATYAAANVARAAISLGHKVTFFINPWNVQHEKIYVPALLNVLLDVIRTEYIVFRGAQYPMSSIQQRRFFRGQLKSFLNTHASLEEQELILDDCAKENSVTLEVPEHLQTLCIEDLRGLKKLGADIQNHGWRHIQHSALTTEEKLENIQKGKKWLTNVLQCEVKDFAVPFGAEDMLRVPPEKDVWYLLDDKRSPGWNGRGFYNRTVLSVC